jgi:hypothetical protein
MKKILTKSLLLHLIIATQIKCAIIQVPSAGYTADNTGLQNAINASSNGGIVEILANTTINVNTADINLSKEITLRGQDRNTSVITTSNRNSTINVSANNATINNLTVRNTLNSSVATCISTNTNLRNLIFTNCNIELSETGISTKQTGAYIANNYFKYIGVNSNSYRFLLIYGNKNITHSQGFNGNFVFNNVFDANNLPKTPTGSRVNCFLLSGVSGADTFEGTLRIEKNQLINPANVNAFLVQELFKGTDFSLEIIENSLEGATGFVQPKFLALFSAVNTPMNYFKRIVLNNNTYTSTRGVGLLEFDGVGGPWNVGTTNDKLFFSGNKIAFPNITDPAVTDLVPGFGLAGYRTAIYNPFTINLPAVANSFKTAIAENGARVINLTGTSYYPGKTYTLSIVTQPKNGNLSEIIPVNLTGTELLAQVVYTPNEGFDGLDEFTFMLSNGGVNSLPGVGVLDVKNVGEVNTFTAAVMAKVVTVSP